MAVPLRILHLEDNRQDADLVQATLAADGLHTDIVRTDNRSDFERLLRQTAFDVILADYNLPVFDGLSAQIIAARLCPDVPFIFLSGSIGEELAVERLKDGATDYVLKDRMARLPSAVRRALAEAAERGERRRAEEDVRRLNAELERRVVERTAELALANQALAERERELRDAKSFLEDLIAASPSMVFRLDPHTFDLLYASPNVGWLLGYAPEEIVQLANFWEQHIHPDDRARVLHEVQGALAAHAVQIEQEYRLRGKDDRYRWFFSLMRVEYDANMQPTTMLRYCLDIADRKRAEDARAESERRLQAILDHSPAVALKDLTGRYVLTNRAFERMVGLPAAALAGRTDADLFARPLAAAYRANDRRVIDQQTGLDFEEVYLRDGKPHTYQSIKFPLPDAAGQPHALCAISIDITARKKADDEVRMARTEAERANRAKSEFLSRMSHDLRTPLNAILGFAQLLELDDLSGDRKESVGQILKGGQHLLALINEVLDIARIEAGHLSLSLEPVGALDVVQQVVELVRPLADARGIGISIEPAADDLVLRADRPRLNQILLNLLSNAVKYNRENGRVTVSFHRLGQRARVAVTDTGAGIPAAKLALLFQPFERLGAEQTAIEGTGLGLALSRGLAEAMGGALGVESAIDRGTMFWIELERMDQVQPRLSATRETRESSAGAAAAGIVLYIEDNRSNVRLMERVLQRRPNVRLVHGPTGEDGVRLARSERPQLIFLDLHLPDMPGEDVLRRLWEDPELRPIPVAILSADATPDHIRRLEASGAVAYLTKPLELRQVLQLIDDRLATRVEESHR